VDETLGTQTTTRQWCEPSMHKLGNEPHGNGNRLMWAATEIRKKRLVS